MTILYQNEMIWFTTMARFSSYQWGEHVRVQTSRSPCGCRENKLLE